MNPSQILMTSIFEKWAAQIRTAIGASALPEAFLAALIANESGGNPGAPRFEPRVYKYLQAVLAGQTPAYAEVTAQNIATEGYEIVQKSESYHALALNDLGQTLVAAVRDDPADATLRQMASSWGLTHIMGYHTVKEPEITPPDLTRPEIELPMSVRMLSDFARRFHLNLAADFVSLLRCWNTGTPWKETFDAEYVPNGLARMGIWREIAVSSPPIT